MTFDLYAWKRPRDLDADGAAALVQRWHDEGADPAASPFEPSEDVGWFHRELTRDEPDLDVVGDAVPNPSTRPVWLASDPAPLARLVALRLTPDTTREAVNDILSLVVKYDLVLFDAFGGHAVLFVRDVHHQQRRHRHQADDHHRREPLDRSHACCPSALQAGQTRCPDSDSPS